MRRVYQHIVVICFVRVRTVINASLEARKMKIIDKMLDNYFTKKQLEYYLINYPYKEFKETSNLDFNVKK